MNSEKAYLRNVEISFKKGVFNLTAVFGSAYLCERTFSKMNLLKDKYRSILMDIHLDNH